MMHAIMSTVEAAARALFIATQLLVLSASIFALLAVIVKGKEAIAGARRAVGELRVNIGWRVFDALIVAPFIGVLVQLVRTAVTRYQLTLVDDSVWIAVGGPATFAAVIFLGDFVSYWRHRLEHTRPLWPAHAIHHSDTEMTWLTLARFHPVNRITTSFIDILCLALLGFPAWALVANEIVRHYYGEFIHADFPWMYGPLRYLLISPVMHRWHHARDVEGAGSNFATVFCVFDRAFGTYYAPGPCTVPLGVNDPIEPGVFGQLVYPFRTWASRLRGRSIAERQLQ
jgi:sterol desaturase/sphingolipid hydroxylase (fatty acid hydroxylase superfamily)